MEWPDLSRHVVPNPQPTPAGDLQAAYAEAMKFGVYALDLAGRLERHNLVHRRGELVLIVPESSKIPHCANVWGMPVRHGKVEVPMLAIRVLLEGRDEDEGGR